MIWTFIERTAWPMTPPEPWSAFHIMISLTGLAAAVFLAGHLSRKSPAAVLWTCGAALAVSELYKQLFLYSVVNQGRYDWWYFPFQLCSTPMYLCLLFPLFPQGRLRTAAAVYLQSFGFLGGIMALVEPSGLMHPYWTLTLHGLGWHILLIFIACYCTASGLACRTDRCFLSALPLFFAFCLVATAINLFTEGQADMFYISPYYPVTQVLFHEISLALGTGSGIAVYLSSVCMGAFLSRRLLNRLSHALAGDALRNS